MRANSWIVNGLLVRIRDKLAHRNRCLQGTAVVDNLCSCDFQISHFPEGIYTATYPSIGPITFEHTAYSVASSPNLRLLMFSPADAPSAQRFSQLLQRQP